MRSDAIARPPMKINLLSRVHPNSSAFAADVDALVISHVLPDHARGADREAHLTPSQIGRLANASNVRFLVLGSRAKRTFGIESASEAAIRESYKGSLIFANDLECWGL